MKKQIINIVLGATVMLWTNTALSYYGPHNGPQVSGQSNIVEKGANCTPATSKLTMSFNDVSALIEQGGSMFQNRSTGVAAYEVPKGSNLKVIFAGALWMGGKDINGQLKLAALTFRSTGNDFWPGPLSATAGSGNYDPTGPVGGDATRDFGAATIDADRCAFYDKFYTIRKSEVIAYNAWWECDNGIQDPADCGDVVKPSNEILNRIYAWPAHGDVTRGEDYFLAPFYDNPDGASGIDGAYRPEDGDTPWYDDILDRDDIECGVDRRISLFGDETHWWVFNDNGNIHGESNGDPIGMEIRAQAFAFATSDDVNRMTFYNYEMINKGTQTLYETYFSQYVDADVGGYDDDYIGCDVSRGLGYAYNGDNLDETSGGNLGYGENPPAIGVDFFEGPYLDADLRDNVGPYFDETTETEIIPTVADAIADNGIVYKGIGLGYSDGLIDNERFGMRRFTYYTGQGAVYPYSDPSNANEFYNFMSGSWANGSEMFYGGPGYGPSATTTPSDYLFPGDSDPLGWATAGAIVNDDWSEVTANTVKGDRRFVQSAGPFTLTPGAINNITVGIVYGRSNAGGLFASVEAMKRADTKAQALFDACFRILEPPYAPKLSIQELENELILSLDNPAASNNSDEGYYEEDKVNIVDPLVDRFYTFEGYQIYQLKNGETSIADIGDDTKAQVIAQCDIKNGIVDLINFDFDEELGFSIGSKKVDAENKGIRHTFQITEDKFAQGTRTLVNHKTYYYIAVAYAHNEFKKYDPNDPLALDGQRMPYISSRLGYDGGSIRSVSGIPHNPSPEAAGTISSLVYGSGPQIKRLDGYGNGNRVINLTSASTNSIIQNGYLENPVYDYGAGPINVKVVDPLNVVGGHFVCKFKDYNTSNSNGADTASWVIKRYTSDGGSLIDSVSSDRTIWNNNEQVIPEWGVSVQINQEKYYVPEGSPSGGIEINSTKLLSESINYVDSTKRWLSVIADNDAYYPTNWIRSGTYEPNLDPTTGDCNPDVADYLNPCNYPDEVGYDDAKEWSKVLGGGIAPHRVVGYQASFMPLAYFNYPGPAAARKNASISFTPSVDIVITADKSKWTRCPVIELGREAALNVGNCSPGAMRKSQSVDKNGNVDGTGTGMGWFPGYAIDVESGARLYLAFGENSFLISDNGGDMLWNPTDRIVDNSGNPILGGMHPIYIYSFQNKAKNNYTLGYNYPAYVPSEAASNSTHVLYNDMLAIEGGDNALKRNVYGSISWIANPILLAGQQFLATEVSISLRVNKEYKNFSTAASPTGGPNGGKPMYSWNMDNIATRTGDIDRLTEVLDIINVVPNPYYAYSEYETSRLDTRVKITNLPEICTIKIYTVNGKLVRTFKKDSPITSVDWDLKNYSGIPVSGGLFLIHVDVPDIGERIVKFYGGMRQIDLQGI